jgi:hydroxymethylglutaryl-CoA lyase
MADTHEVLQGLQLVDTHTKLLAIVANKRGAEEAVAYEAISYLGYPFSISETFQLRNTNASIEASLSRVEEIQVLCLKHSKSLVLYVSMAFGNPYGDPWHPDVAIAWADRLYRLFGVSILALSDTIGSSNPQSISTLFSALIPELPQVQFGAHLHTTPDKWEEKVEAAWQAGCRRFDGALKGYGGCPMAADELTGNMPTEHMVDWFARQGIETGINPAALQDALRSAALVFG